LIIGEEKIKQYLSEACIPHQGGYLYKIREHGKTWGYEIGDRKYVIKLNKQIEGLTANPVKLFRNYLNNAYFKNEIAVFKSLEGVENKYLHYPGIVSTDEKNYLILEFIDGEKGWNESLIDTSVFAGAIMEFNTLSYIKKPITNEHDISNILNNPLLKVIRWSISQLPKRLGLKITLKTLITVFRISKETQIMKMPFLVHGDLFRKNNVFTTMKGISLIDFESSILGHKWILADIIDLAIRDDFSFDKHFFWLYMDSLKRSGIQLDAIFIKGNVHMVFIYRVLCCLVYKKRPVDLNHEELRKFLLRNLLEDNGFNLWYEHNILRK
jgi:hypothetical protein